MVKNSLSTEIKTSVENKKGLLTKSHRLEVLNMLSQFKSVTEIANHLESQYNIANQYQNIYCNYFKNKKYIPFINALRNKYLESYLDVSNANKKIRLIKLNKILEKEYSKYLRNDSQDALDNVVKLVKEMRTEVDVPAHFGSGQGTVFQQNNTYALTNIKVENKPTEVLIEELNRRLSGQHKS